MALGWEEAGFLCVYRFPSDRTDFEVLQRAVLPAFAPLLRKHPADPKCKAAELGFLLRAGWVVVGPLRGRGCSWCAPAGGARAKCRLESVLHRDFGNTLATYAPITAVIFSFSLLLSTPDPGPGCTWPGCSSWVPTRRLVRISNPRLRGTQAQKPRPRSEKPWRWAWP